MLLLLLKSNKVSHLYFQYHLFHRLRLHFYSGPVGSGLDLSGFFNCCL